MTLSVPLMPRLRRWVCFGCFFRYVLRRLSSIRRVYYAVVRPHSSRISPGFVSILWVVCSFFVVVRAVVTRVVVFFWPCHADWVDA